MSLTVYDIMRHVRNAFPAWYHLGRFTIADGRLDRDELMLEGGWISIFGSERCDGVYRVEEGRLRPAPPCDERFEGWIYRLHPPADFLALCDEIIAWEEKNTARGLKSERFGSYSYEAATDENGAPLGWQQVFRARLTPFRRMFAEEALPC